MSPRRCLTSWKRHRYMIGGLGRCANKVGDNGGDKILFGIVRVDRRGNYHLWNGGSLRRRGRRRQ